LFECVAIDFLCAWYLIICFHLYFNLSTPAASETTDLSTARREEMSSAAQLEAFRAQFQAGGPGAAAALAAFAAARGISIPQPPAAYVPHPSAAYASALAASAANEQAAREAAKEKAKADAAAIQEGQDDGHEVEDDIAYTPYKPTKLKYGRNHPDPVVENATLAAVAPPDITYNLAMPADIITEGRLSNLQLEAVVYGCQRHMMDLPRAVTGQSIRALQTEKENVMSEMNQKMPAKSEGKMADAKQQGDRKSPPEVALKREPPAVRAGFLLGDGAGMGKGRTLAGFVVENIARGRKKHVWVSVSSDLYEG